MQKIIYSIDELKKGQPYLRKTNFDYKNYDCTLSHLAQMLDNKNYSGLLTFYKEMIQKKHFEIELPFDTSIILRAVYSINNDPINFVFFIDKDNQHLLVWIQTCNIVNYFIYKNTIYIVSYAWGDDLNGSIGTLVRLARQNEINPESLIFCDKQWGFCLKHWRPAHYFHHILVNYIHLKQQPILHQSTFFNLKGIQNQSGLVYFYPFTYLDANNDFLDQQVFKESLEDFNSLVENQDKMDKFDKIDINQKEISSFMTTGGGD